MTLAERLSEYIQACFSGIWIESHEHEDALAEIAQLCRREKWRLAVWDLEQGLQVSGATSVQGSSGGDPLAAIRALAGLVPPLSDFDWSFNPSIKRAQIYDLATCRFIREAKDVLLVGPPGTGKSFLAQALGYEAIKQGHVVLYRSIFDVVRDFLHDEALEGQERILGKYLRPDLLIVDDMGMKNLARRSGDFLFEIIMRRYETRSTMMTSNRPIQEWGKLIGDVPSATAILDRFLHHADVIPIAGKSYRLRNQQARAELPATEVETTEKPNAAILPPGSPPTPSKRKKGTDQPAEACQT